MMADDEEMADCPHPAMRKIAQFILDNRHKPVDERIREAVLKSILDLTVCAMLGVGESGPSAVRSVLSKTDGHGNVPVWFTGKTSSVIGAAWANAAAAMIMDLDDGHRLARGHPGAAVIPSVFALAYGIKAPFDDVVAAIFIGYEIGISIAAARSSYGGSGTWTAAAVASAAAALSDMDLEQIEHALAFAIEEAPNQAFQSSPAPRNPPPEGSDTKEGIPWAVKTGLTAFYLAGAGHSGPRNILESDRLYKPFPQDWQPGASPHVCATYLKLYTSCRHTHPPVDAMRQILARNIIDPHQIDAIEVEIYSGALRITNKPAPLNTIDVQYSIPYVLALVALVGPETLLPVTQEALVHTGVADLARKVTLSLNDEFDRRFPAETVCRVTVSVQGERFSSDVTAPKGEASDPLSWVEIEEKLRMATRYVATGKQQQQLIDCFNRVRRGDFADLARVFDTDLQTD